MDYRTQLQTRRIRRLTVLGACLFGWLGAGVASGQETLTLRVNDTQVDAGGRVAIVLRTYASRPIGQGQLCFNIGFAGNGPQSLIAKGAGSPFTALESFVIFSEQGDVEANATFDATTQQVLVDFSSVSATVNVSDGPFGVFFFRVDGNLTPGTSFDIAFDPGDTFLVDALGRPVAIRPRSGEMVIRQPGAAYQLEAGGGEAVPGRVALLAIETSELFAIGSGEIGFRYPTEIAAGQPTVSVDPRYGMVSHQTWHPEAGLVVIGVDSADGSFNGVPGEILTVELPIRGDAVIGALYPLSLDGPTTFLSSPSGSPISLVLGAAEVEVILEPALFEDGFESAGFGEWTAVQN